MATKNKPGEINYYMRAEPDEPVFVLLGRDRHAPTLVWLWATLRELDGEDSVKVKEARECVLAMLNWGMHHNRPAVGLGQAAMAALLDLIRTINSLSKDVEKKNSATDDDVMRRFLAFTDFDFSGGVDKQ